MNRIDNIINEEIENVLITEGILNDIYKFFKKFGRKDKKNSSSDNDSSKKSSDDDNESKKKKSNKKSIDDIRKERKLRKKRAKDKKGRKKIRKLKGGGKKYYDYDDFIKKHRKISKSDADSIIDRIDQEKTNIAAVARIIFKDHTNEGGQSHLLKILNRERPMTKDVATKLVKMISSGQIAVK